MDIFIFLFWYDIFLQKELKILDGTSFSTLLSVTLTIFHLAAR